MRLILLPGNIMVMVSAIFFNIFIFNKYSLHGAIIKT